jgi:hypothetical protein
MKSIFLFLLFFVSTHCLTQETIQGEIDVFINSFITAVEKHDTKQTIGHLDKQYVKTQLKEFLKNNEEQFLNELFSGEDCSTKTWVNFKFDEINSIEVAEITEESLNNYKIIFRVKNAQREAKCDLQLKKTVKKKKVIYGFVGAVG